MSDLVPTNKKLLLVRVSSDVKDNSLLSLYNFVQHFGIEVIHRDVSTKQDLEDALKLGSFDYLYFAGHGDETCFTDNKLLNLTWTEIGELICQTSCLNNNAIVMLYCCKGGLSPVVFELMATCPSVQYVCGAKQNVSGLDLTTGFVVFLYNVEHRKIDPTISANKATDATDIRFQCFNRVDVEFNPMYFHNYCKNCN